ncbi:MAG: V-type ATP synthase subunit I [Candidatus Methanomethylophilaceae archaeon]|nr:V-type ATP synthase subunit I [Candidatus Methanomethylophilaceae archaeon]
MSLPESMSRIVIVGTRSRIDEAIDALYSVGAVHLIDHITGADEGFSIGHSRPYTSKASERLLKVRAMEKELSIDKHTKAPSVPFDEISRKIESGGVESVDEEVYRVIDERNRINQKVTELNARKTDLETLSVLPVDLDLYSGYESISVLVGAVSGDPSESLKALESAECFISADRKKGGAVAVFVRNDDKDKASAILSDYGFTEMSVPEGKGPAAEALSETEAAVAAAEADLVAVGEQIEALREKHKTFLKAAEERLSITVEQGSIPLHIATSDYSYVVDAWVPTKQTAAVVDGITAVLGDSVHMEVQEDRGRNLHESEEAEERFKEAPTKMKNGNYGEKFEYPTKLVSVPKYQEIDPSILIGIFLPLFFGFMVGDVGYAIPFIILGAYGLKVAKNKDWRAIATVLFFGGIWAFLFGLFFFGEMLGMHFIGSQTATSTTWEVLLGVTFPDWFNGVIVGIGKLHEVTFLLKLSVYIGIVHLMVGYVCGYINIRMQHGNKAAFFEKGGWIITFMGMVLVCWALTEILFNGRPVEGDFMYITLVGVALLVAGVAVNFKTEKIQAILELPGIVGNILSYTRLAAIGMSKAGMALAFNYIAIFMVADGLGGMAGIIVGLVVFSFCHLMVWTLAILSGGLHALRLQYVEMMSKFFVGGGKLFNPLAIRHKQTKPVSSQETVSAKKSTTEV